MASSLVTRKLLKDACQVQVYAARYFQFLNEINLLVKNEFIFYLYIYLGLGQALACQGQALRLGQARGVRPNIRFLDLDLNCLNKINIYFVLFQG